MRQAIQMQSSEDITIGRAFEEFINEKKVMKLSPASIRCYSNNFKDFTRFIPDDTLCADITNKTVFQFIEFLQIRNPSIQTTSINSAVRHLRAILYNFMEKGYTENFKIKLLKCEKPLKETYTEFELERLLKKPDKNKCSFADYRNWVIVCYLLGTGNRLDTLHNLKNQGY